MARPTFAAALITLAPLLLAACAEAPQTKATAGEGGRVQDMEFRRIFNLDNKGFHDMVVVARDFEEEINKWEKTLVISHAKDDFAFFEFTSFEHKKMGDDRIRHLMADFWPVDLRQDPSRAVMVLIEAKAEFVLAGAKQSAGGLPGVASIAAEMKFLSVDRHGKISEVEQKPGEGAGAFAAILAESKKEGARPVPLHWQLLASFCLAERAREAGGTENIVKATRGYQWILDTIAHARAGEGGEEMIVGENDLRNPAYLEAFTRKRIETLK